MASNTKGEMLLLLLWKAELEQGVQHPQQDISSCPTEPLWVLPDWFNTEHSWKFGSNGSRLKENIIFELILGSKIGPVFGRFNAINSKFWRMSPPEWSWDF